VVDVDNNARTRSYCRKALNFEDFGLKLSAIAFCIEDFSLKLIAFCLKILLLTSTANPPSPQKNELNTKRIHSQWSIQETLHGLTSVLSSFPPIDFSTNSPNPI